MLVLVTEETTNYVYEEISEDVCIAILQKKSGRDTTWCQLLYGLLEKYPKLILQNSIGTILTFDYFKESSYLNTVLGLDYLNLADMKSVLNTYSEFIVLSDIVCPGEKTFVDLYFLTGFTEFQKINTMLRKITISSLLKTI